MHCLPIKRGLTASTLLSIIVLSLFVSLSFYAHAEEGLREPTSNDRQIVRLVNYLMPHEHLSKRVIDSELSNRWLDNFLKSLDFQKAYFLKSDIESFKKQRENMGVWLKEGNIKFAYIVFNTFLVRMDERIGQIDELLKQPIDFTVDESICVEREKLDYPADTQEAMERWRKRIKYDLLILKVDDTEGQKAIDKLSRRYKSFQRRMHQMDSDELLELYLTSMTTAYDPHTSYMSPSTLENFDIQMRLELEGIGASLMSEDGYTVIKKLVPGGAAEKSGQLKIDDKIVGVGQGENGQFEDIVDMKLDDVVKKIRGKANTVVRLQVSPENGGKSKEVRIVRAKIELKDSEAKGKVFEAGKKADGSPYKIGIIDLPSFYLDMQAARTGRMDYRSTTRDMKAILDNFNAQNVDACIVDLRSNGGGSLQESISATGLFIDQGPVVQVKDSGDNITNYKDLDEGMTWNKPLVVLISKFSASASEIFAGAIQDYHRGIIIGDTATHGKGTVQSLMNLGETLYRISNSPKMGALKVTMQQFYRPDGASTQNRGVVSDVVLPSITSYMDVGESDLDYALPFDKVNALSYQKAFDVTTPIVKYLAAASANRCAQSEEFQKIERKIQCYLKNKNKDNITLNEKKFMEERAELIPEEEEKKQLEDQLDNQGLDIKETPYLREAMNVAADYTQILTVGLDKMPPVPTTVPAPAPSMTAQVSVTDPSAMNQPTATQPAADSSGLNQPAATQPATFPALQ